MWSVVSCNNDRTVYGSVKSWTNRTDDGVTRPLKGTQGLVRILRSRQVRVTERVPGETRTDKYGKWVKGKP